MTDSTVRLPTTASHRGRSVRALLAGFAVGVIPTIATDVVMHATGMFPPWGQPMSDGLFVLATMYRTAFGLASAWVVVRLAPRRPMAHALGLGALGMLVSLAGAIATWSEPSYGPHWYPVTLVVLALPTAWAGASLALSLTSERPHEG